MDDNNRASLGSDRNTWIRFEEQTDGHPNEVQIQVDRDGQNGCATIEPTDSIQINAGTDRLKRSSSSPLSSLANVLPQNQTINANIMSNIESNKVVDKKFINNNNTELNGETSTASAVVTLQTVPLKDVNGVQAVDCKHGSCQQRNGFSE